MAAASPQAHWTYADLAREFGHGASWVKAHMPGFEREGFPAPLPWSRRQKRWNAEAVRRWMTRQELREGSLGAPDLRVVNGGG